MRRVAWLGIALLLLASWAWWQAPHASVAADAGNNATTQSPSMRGPAGDQAAFDQASRWPDFLPRQALDTLRRIERGGPFDHRQDGSTFANREQSLPPRPRGYYREYTVETPGSRDRGARRIVSGGGVPGQSPPLEYFYTDDHYRSFRRFAPSPRAVDAPGPGQ